jgi:hypothetical protein
MAMKPTKKPSAKKIATKLTERPKAKVTNSRGSNSAKQVGDMNQREWFNAQRDVKQKRTKSGKIIGSTVPGSKVSKSDADSQGFDMADERKRQRAGGGGSAPRKKAQAKPKSLKSKIGNKLDSAVQGAADSVFSSKSKGQFTKGGPRPKMERMAQPAKPKRMAKKGR